MGLTVLLVGFHFLRQLLFGHLDEVVVLLDGLLDDLPLVLPLLGQMLQQLSLLVLVWSKRTQWPWGPWGPSPPGQNHPLQTQQHPQSWVHFAE